MTSRCVAQHKNAARVAVTHRSTLLSAHFSLFAVDAQIKGAPPAIQLHRTVLEVRVASTMATRTQHSRRAPWHQHKTRLCIRLVLLRNDCILCLQRASFDTARAFRMATRARYVQTAQHGNRIVSTTRVPQCNRYSAIVKLVIAARAAAVQEQFEKSSERRLCGSALFTAKQMEIPKVMSARARVSRHP